MNETNKTLQALAELADRENAEREAQLNNGLSKKKKKRKIPVNASEQEEKKDQKKQAEDRSEQKPDPVSRNTGKMKAVTDEQIMPPLPELKDEPSDEPAPPPKKKDPKPKEDPFSELAEQMNEEGSALQAKKEKPKKHQNKIKKVGKEELGEEVTKEHAESVMSGKKGGHRATVIVRRTVVGQDSGKLEGETNIVKPDVEEEKPAVPSLFIVREDTGEAYELCEDMTVGREDDNDIVIPNPEGHYVSAHHGHIEVQGKDIFVKDLGSTNGTYVNDRKVASKRLREGDTIEFADIRFIVERR